MNTLLQQLFRLTQKLAGQDHNGRGAIANLVVLGFRYIDENFCSCVIDMDRLFSCGRADKKV